MSSSRYANAVLGIYACESASGSQWHTFRTKNRIAFRQTSPHQAVTDGALRHRKKAQCCHWHQQLDPSASHWLHACYRASDPQWHPCCTNNNKVCQRQTPDKAAALNCRRCAARCCPWTTVTWARECVSTCSAHRLRWHTWTHILMKQKRILVDGRLTNTSLGLVITEISNDRCATQKHPTLTHEVRL